MEQTASKVRTLRMTDEQSRELQAVSTIDGVSASHAMREAVDRYIEERRSDPEFQARRKRYLEEHRDILERLAE